MSYKFKFKQEITSARKIDKATVEFEGKYYIY